MGTHQFDPLSGGGTDFPRALLSAGILVGPVGTRDDAIGTVDLLFALSCANNDSIS